MKQQILSFLLVLAVLIGPASFSLQGQSVAYAGVAGELQKNLTTSGTDSGFKSDTKLSTVVGMVIKTFLGLLGIVFIIMIIYAGFEWIQAQGEENKIGEARKMIIHSVIVLIIVMAAYSITLFVLTAVQDATNTLKQ